MKKDILKTWTEILKTYEIMQIFILFICMNDSFYCYSKLEKGFLRKKT